MAAVAAEPGASAVPTTTVGNDLELEQRPAHSGIESQSDTTLEYAPVMDLVPQFNNRDAAEECGRVQIELANSSRPEVEAAGKALAARSAEEHIKESGCLSLGGKENITEDISVETYGSEYNTLSTGQSIRERFPSMVESANEVCNIAVKQHEPYAFHQNSSIITDSQPSVVFLHSFPTHPPPSEAGLSLAEPAEPTTTDYYQNPQITRPTEICDYRALIKPTLGGELEPEPIYDDPPSAEYKNAGTSDDAVLERSVIIKDQVVDPLMVSDIEAPLGTAFEMDCSCDFASVKAQNSIDELRVNDAVVMVPRSTAAELQQSPCYSQKRRSETDLLHIKNDTTESIDSTPPLPYPFDPTEVPLVSVEQLTPGSEVRVSLDHIIDDALVVSFRLGDKVFSGVLMDLSKRFGPYGIPITVFPKREYKDKPQSMQLHRQPDPGSDSNEEPKRMPAAEDKVLTDPTATDTAQGAVVEVADPTPASQPQPACPPHPWTSKPPPLFQEGAPYPPPLFIRDTYNQSLPQPLPRKIKRPKRRLYREEPTSIMNAIKLRPRQVLCDKCKGVVVSSGPRESTSRRGPASDLRNEDAKRRRQTDSSSAASSKRPRNDTKEEKGRTSETSKRQITSGLRVSSSSPSSSSLARGGGAGSRVLRGVASTSSSLTSSNSTANSNNSRVHLNSSKKILGSKTSGVDQSKAREVLKLARTAQAAHRRQQREAASSTTTTHPNPAGANVPKTMTRAAALQVANQNQKVHFTRRLQQLSGVGPHAPLPPRMRIKPQRYRNEEGQVPSSSSPPKQPPCLSADKGLAGSRLTPPKPASCSALDSDPNPATFSPPTPASPPASALGRAFASFPNAAPTLAPATGVPPCPSTPSTSSSSSSSSASTGEAIFAFDSQVISSVPRLQPQPESCSGTELEDDEQQEKREEKKESAADTPVASSNLVVFMTLDPSRQADSSSLCSLDTDDLKSSISECSSTETVDFPLQGNLHSSSSSNPPPPTPSLAPPGSSSSSPPPLNVLPQTSKEEVGDGNKRRKSSKASTFSKNVTKCVSAEGRTICVGDIVWAKIHGFPWWPARVVGITVSRRDTGLLVQQEARVSWFGSPTTSFLPTTQLAPFLESFQSRFDKKRKGLYRKAITEAARAAKQLTPEVRALLTQFET